MPLINRAGNALLKIRGQEMSGVVSGDVAIKKGDFIFAEEQQALLSLSSEYATEVTEDNPIMELSGNSIKCPIRMYSYDSPKNNIILCPVRMITTPGTTRLVCYEVNTLTGALTTIATDTLSYSGLNVSIENPLQITRIGEGVVVAVLNCYNMIDGFKQAQIEFVITLTGKTLSHTTRVLEMLTNNTYPRTTNYTLHSASFGNYLFYTTKTSSDERDDVSYISPYIPGKPTNTSIEVGIGYAHLRSSNDFDSIVTSNNTSYQLCLIEGKNITVRPKQGLSINYNGFQFITRSILISYRNLFEENKIEITAHRLNKITGTLELKSVTYIPIPTSGNTYTVQVVPLSGGFSLAIHGSGSQADKNLYWCTGTLNQDLSFTIQPFFKVKTLSDKTNYVNMDFCDTKDFFLSTYVEFPEIPYKNGYIVLKKTQNLIQRELPLLTLAEPNGPTNGIAISDAAINDNCKFITNRNTLL